MIKEILRWLFGDPPKSPYNRGYDYAMAELQKHGWEVEKRLEAEADGAFNSTSGHREFDDGVRHAIRDFKALQKEIVNNEIRKLFR